MKYNYYINPPIFSYGVYKSHTFTHVSTKHPNDKYSIFATHLEPMICILSIITMKSSVGKKINQYSLIIVHNLI